MKKTTTILTPEEERVMWGKGTEAPFSGTLLHEKRSGTFVCKACGAPLFNAGTKFDSGSGWPSFSDALPDAVSYFDDTSHGMQRVAVDCASCGGHLGHIFPDTSPTGKQFCINSVSLDFKEEK